ncbi:MAG: T9SS type A sorting domain-containing protein [Saprospirales bacterium]|nr:T9SS type A sorting domain-containing protein [Saprospirales bacterium]
MKRMLLAVFSALWFHASAQITVTAATFPAVGDTFRYAIDLSPTVNNLITPGSNQTWDFSGLSIDQTFETIYLTPAGGAYQSSFPGAELRVNANANGESYFNVTNTLVELLGYGGGDPTGLGVNVLARFSPPIIERRSPLNFIDFNSQTTDLSLPFPTSALPPAFDSLISSVPGGNFVDSIRVRLHFERQSVIDGWGTVLLPNASAPKDVLRERRNEYTTTALDVHVALPAPIGGWFDIATFIQPGSGGLADLLGTDTTYSYRFISNTDKEDIAVVTASNDFSTAETVRFKNISGVSDAPGLDAPGAASIQAFPNPAIQWVRFECTNLPADEYTLKIFDIVGKVVWKETQHITGKRSFKVNLEDFNKGTYLYSLVNQKGLIIGTKRLVVVKP